jgi:hypothetical protein
MDDLPVEKTAPQSCHSNRCRSEWLGHLESPRVYALYPKTEMNSFFPYALYSTTSKKKVTLIFWVVLPVYYDQRETDCLSTAVATIVVSKAAL